jgi:hypothetical protein
VQEVIDVVDWTVIWSRLLCVLTFALLLHSQASRGSFHDCNVT